MPAGYPFPPMCAAAAVRAPTYRRTVSEIGLQGSLFDGGEPEVGDFAGLQRIALDDRSWVDWAPGWLRGSDELFAELYRTGRFSRRTVRVWDRTVPEPRLTAGWDADVDGAEMPPAQREVAAALFLTEHSVETALTLVYQKLGVRSRAELAHRMAINN